MVTAETAARTGGTTSRNVTALSIVSLFAVATSAIAAGDTLRALVASLKPV